MNPLVLLLLHQSVYLNGWLNTLQKRSRITFHVTVVLYVRWWLLSDFHVWILDGQKGEWKVRRGRNREREGEDEWCHWKHFETFIFHPWSCSALTKVTATQPARPGQTGRRVQVPRSTRSFNSYVRFDQKKEQFCTEARRDLHLVWYLLICCHSSDWAVFIHLFFLFHELHFVLL